MQVSTRPCECSGERNWRSGTWIRKSRVHFHQRSTVHLHVCGQIRPELTELLDGVSEAEVRRQLRKDDTEAASKGEETVHETSPTGFLTLGLELEELQYIGHTWNLWILISLQNTHSSCWFDFVTSFSDRATPISFFQKAQEFSSTARDLHAGGPRRTTQGGTATRS
jgi:hypothetical protein